MTAYEEARAGVDVAVDAAVAAARLEEQDHAEATLHAQETEIDALTRDLEAAEAKIRALTVGTPMVPGPVIGARTADIPFTQATAEVGPLRVTRLFHRELPAKFTRAGIPDGVLLIVSFKGTRNLSSYVESIPDDAAVQLCYHHESEGDYADGSTFRGEFSAAQAEAWRVNPAVPFVFIGGGSQYTGPNRAGYSGAFIPTAADRYYLDRYQQGTPGSPLRPAEQDPAVQRYMDLLEARGKDFHGFTEYGRGMTDVNHPLTPALISTRIEVLRADATYLRALPDFRVWCYWYTDDSQTAGAAPVKQWRLTDPGSQAAWRTIARGGTP